MNCVRRLRDSRYWLPNRIVGLCEYMRPSQTTLLLGTALLVGAGAGAGAILFRWLIATVRYLAFTTGASVLSFLGASYVILVPACGGLLVGPLIYYFAREAKGQGCRRSWKRLP